MRGRGGLGVFFIFRVGPVVDISALIILLILLQMKEGICSFLEDIVDLLVKIAEQGGCMVSSKLNIGKRVLN